MALKRPHDDSAKGRDGRNTKKHRKGFVVGPDNLPDGTHRRKVIKIKRALIDKAKIRKEYAKLKERNPEFQTTNKDHQIDGKDGEKAPENVEAAAAAAADEEEWSGVDSQDEKSNTKHTKPSLSAPKDTSIRKPEQLAPPPDPAEGMHRDRFQRQKRPKIMPFTKQVEAAEARRRETEERRQRFEQANKERQEKIEERERFRRAMAKARTGGKNGQRKLGRESSVLLEKVQRMVGK